MELAEAYQQPGIRSYQRSVRMEKGKGIIIEDMEIGIRDSPQYHVHTAEVIGLGRKFLAVELADVGMLLQTEQEGA